MRKAFRSRVVYDQEVFSRESMPAAMRETYMSCDAPPPLDKLNCFRLVVTIAVFLLHMPPALCEEEGGALYE